MLQEVIDKSEPQKPGGQQVGGIQYQMVPSTRRELQRIARYMREAISAAERPAPTWQPIEQAKPPADGRWIWVQSKHSNRLITPMKFDVSRERWFSGYGWWGGESDPPFACWMEMNVTEPLPAPPGPVAQEKDKRNA